MDIPTFRQYLTPETLAQWHALVNDAHRIVLTGHAGPDGDTMGAALTMWHYLKALGKEVRVVMPNMYPDFLAWLPGAQGILIAHSHAEEARNLMEEANLVFCLDYNAPQRLEDFADGLLQSTAPRIMVDHHLKPEPFCQLVVSDPKASSTCEIVFSLLWQLEALPLLTREAATCLYCGMMTDTGAFTYNSSRPDIYRIIAELLAMGVNKDRVYRRIYHSYSEKRMRLMGYILYKKMEYMADQKASLFTLTREEMQRFCFKKGDAEGLVNLPLEIKGTRLSVSLREDTEKPLVRVSLRSVDDFPCNRMAEEYFNGGGHLNASGGTLHMSMAEAVGVAHKAIQAYAPLLTGKPATPNPQPEPHNP